MAALDSLESPAFTSAQILAEARDVGVAAERARCAEIVRLVRHTGQLWAAASLIADTDATPTEAAAILATIKPARRAR